MLKIITKSVVYSLFFVLFACVKKEEPTAEFYLSKGFEGAKKKKFETCIYNLSKIDEKFPYSTYSKKSTPVLIYCNYMQKNYEAVHTMVESFESLHPTSNQLAYLYYLRALSYYRAFGNYRKSQENLENLTLMATRLSQIAPESQYVKNLNKLLPFIRTMEDSHTLYIAQHYTQTQNYISAAGRLAELHQATSSSETQRQAAQTMNALLANFGTSPK